MTWGKSHTNMSSWHSISPTKGVKEKLYLKRLVLSCNLLLWWCEQILTIYIEQNHYPFWDPFCNTHYPCSWNHWRSLPVLSQASTQTKTLKNKFCIIHKKNTVSVSSVVVTQFHPYFSLDLEICRVQATEVGVKEACWGEWMGWKWRFRRRDNFAVVEVMFHSLLESLLLLSLSGLKIWTASFCH